MIKAVIFDMDGVLIDSVEVGFQARKKLLTRYNVDLDSVPDPQGEGHRAASLKTLLASVKSHHGIDIDHDEFARKSREHMREDLEEHGISADPALIAFLKELKQHDIICAIVSSGLREGLDIKLEVLGIKQYFSVIVTGSDVKEHKPRPQPYLYALKKLNLPAEECVIFEDSLTGVQAAQAAGGKVIGFTQYNPAKEPLPGVIATVKNWSEISYIRLERICSEINSNAVGLKRGTVQIVSYNPEWPKLFEAEKQRLQAALGNKIGTIEHIGSTSVPGLAAKPLIDMIAEVDDLNIYKELIMPLEKLGYEFIPERVFADRVFFPKGPRERRTHHLSLVVKGSGGWRQPLEVRDNLRKNSEAREAYQRFKEDLARKYPDDRASYTKAKQAFIDSRLQRS